MQEKVTDGTATIVEPKKEVVECDHDYEATHLSSKVDEDENSLHVQIKQEIDFNSVEEQLKTKENINNHVESELSCQDQEKVINTEPEVIINVDLQAVVNDTSIPTVEIPNCNVKQLVVVETNNQLSHLGEEHCCIEGNKGNNESQEKEEAVNCVLQEDPVLTERAAVLEEQTEFENEDLESSDADLECIENNPEFIVIDIADFDPEDDPEDNINPIPEDIEKTTNEPATNKIPNKPAPSKKKLTDAGKIKLLENLEKTIIRNNLNPSQFPVYIHKKLKQINKRERRLFIDNIISKLADKRNQHARANKKQPFTRQQKLQFLKDFENWVDCGMIDLRNIPLDVWNTLSRLSSKQRKKFLRTMREKQMRRSSGGPESNYSGNFIQLSNSSSKSNFREIDQASHYESLAIAWRKSHEYPDSRNKLYSFDRDFHDQRLRESSIATTSNVYSQYSKYQETSMNRNNSYDSESSYRPFNDSFRTPNTDSAASWRSYDRDGASRQSYSDGSYYQAMSRYSGDASRSKNDSRVKSNQSSNNNPSKRKLPDVSSDNHTTIKWSRMKFDKAQIKPTDKSVTAVINDNSNPMGKINADKAALLSSELIRRIDEASSSASAYIPRFNNSGLSKSVFKINCADQRSFDWLSAMVSTLPELWNGAKLHVAKFVPSSERVHIAIFVPSGAAEENSNTIIQRLQRQNPELTTEAWRVFRQVEKSRGQLFFLTIDKLSVEVLKKMHYKGFLGLSSIKFQIQDQKNQRKYK